MPIIPSIVNWLTLKRMNQINLFRKYPIEAQLEVFFKLINKAKNTEWGKKYGYDSIRTIEEFQKRVPVNSYEDIKPEIERIRQGGKNILWPGEIKWFAKSSGTTSSKSKFIPVSKESLEENHFRGGRDVIVLYTDIHPKTNIFKGKGLVIGGSQQVNNFNNEIYYGDLSAVLIENLPFWVHFIRTPDISIALMEEWEEKIDKMAKSTIKQNVTNISGVPSWTLVLIKRVFELTGKDNLLDVWPQLELFIHGGVSFEPYRSQYRQIIPSDRMNYMETYNASEGFFAIQDEPHDKGMLLMLDIGVFYEFIPMDELDKPAPKAISLADVEPDKNYAMIISSNNGLWRYMIGDTVKFTSLFPFKIKITGRTKHFINAFGEEVIIDNAQKALQIACERTGANIKEYTAAPIFMEQDKKGGHEWLIEFEQTPDDLEHFTELLDSTLKAVNSDYEAKRYKNMSLGRPVVHIARAGIFYRWLKNKGKLGGQHKIPRLANHREYMDDLLKLNKA
jgi:hypothetical protein